MKKILAVLATFAITLGMARAAILFTPVGPVTLKLEAIVQETPFTLTGSKTNQSKTATNITQMLKATTTMTPFSSADMLALLANSFNTNFPAGAQIGMRFGALFVVDSTGTNIILTPTGVISFQFEEDLTSATETAVQTENGSGTQTSGNLAETFTCSAVMTYDDTLNTPTDGTHTKFAFKGLYTVKYAENLKSRLVKTTSEFQGTGGGPVRNVQTILTGTISGKATGTVPLF
jgi:hypothetical protein